MRIRRRSWKYRNDQSPATKARMRILAFTSGLKTMNIKKNLIKAHQVLKTSSPTPNLDCEVLLSHVLGKPREWILAHPEEKVADADEQKFLQLVNKRLAGEPVAYLVSHKEFFGLDFVVDKRVPVPRPETEMLVEEVITFITSPRKRGCVSSPSWDGLIIEVGTGSGCIAISLAKNLPDTHITATDISEDALDVAQENARKHGVDERITFLRGDLIDGMIHESEDAHPRPRGYRNAPILVANLPYLPRNVYQTADTSVHLEPTQAHLGGEKGYEIIEKFLQQSAELKPQAVFLEFHYEYKTELNDLIKKYLPNYNIGFKKDLEGRDRVVCITT